MGVMRMAALERRGIGGPSFPASTMARLPVLREPDSQLLTNFYHTASMNCVSMEVVFVRFLTYIRANQHAPWPAAPRPGRLGSAGP